MKLNKRIINCFEQKKRAAFVTFITAGDQDYEKSLTLINSLPKAGADIIELGMPFTDPIADGEIIQKSTQRSLKTGQNQKKTLELVKAFRLFNKKTPIILMGYYNPIYRYGIKKFIKDAKNAQIDGLIIVDLPPEHAQEVSVPANKQGIDFINIITPNTNIKRIPFLVKNSSGYIYYISINGVTGGSVPIFYEVEKAVKLIRKYTNLPIAVGFGVKNRNSVKKLANISDAVVVGSALLKQIEIHCYDQKTAISNVLNLTSRLSRGLVKI
ncbi:tryptophan synthase subunit alpha [Candidatus Portiera aleyrodidarum]|uniref:Tryptophan synthase alpha chain n=1 Tax=Candidatus Portiera aleyrodidarum MED (Bemisia tabaci) TaxID=1163752 RepID=A0AAU8RZ78_9GAMM|nr:tryptophan synthase subunit alpha [Candidatus Portiera aleyrodidarum]AFS18939.1 Tryptophan synthase alpha chain [Candidatus Portiera aleyrodidarum BT-QVLC]AFT80592.1 Tryptophan synthase alpha chain [Candidatus Portiera aleyrodidarum BT-QVLC]AJF24161.1 tryptophan synthase subunit alpha [Candidatus Portiera aleyrodidarum MED (Bemisia tabaci)]